MKSASTLLRVRASIVARSSHPVVFDEGPLGMIARPIGPSEQLEEIVGLMPFLTSGLFDALAK